MCEAVPVIHIILHLEVPNVAGIHKLQAAGIYAESEQPKDSTRPTQTVQNGPAVRVGQSGLGWLASLLETVLRKAGLQNAAKMRPTLCQPYTRFRSISHLL